MSKNTMTDLVEVLETRNTPDGRYDTLIAEAKAGEFHDYKNKKYVCGKTALVIHIQNDFPELKDIAEDVKHGVYDEEMDEEDKAKMREELKRDGMGDMLGMFGLEE